MLVIMLAIAGLVIIAVAARRTLRAYADLRALIAAIDDERADALDRLSRRLPSTRARIAATAAREADIGTAGADLRAARLTVGLLTEALGDGLAPLRRARGALR